MIKSDHILRSWDSNADEWDRIIESSAIPSREITNPAIIQTIMDHDPSAILDIGCGQGWLVRELNSRGIKAEGVDGTEKLVLFARTKGQGVYFHKSYAEITADATWIRDRNIDAAVFNFCLYEKDIAGLLLSVFSNLQKPAKIFIQTLHPGNLELDEASEGKWMQDSWKGLEGSFVDPHPWYARSQSGWIALFENAGLRLIELREPQSSETNKRSSVIFVLTQKALSPTK